MDWATRKVLAWRLSDTLCGSFCVEALEEAIAKYGKSEIVDRRSRVRLGSPLWLGRISKYRWMGEAVISPSPDHSAHEWDMKQTTGTRKCLGEKIVRK
jgi:hypothetical protein